MIHSRVKGAECPVCADRAVLSGYNELATTDPNLLAQWDYDKNTDVSPEHISRSSMRKFGGNVDLDIRGKERFQKEL